MGAALGGVLGLVGADVGDDGGAQARNVVDEARRVAREGLVRAGACRRGCGLAVVDADLRRDLGPQPPLRVLVLQPGANEGVVLNEAEASEPALRLHRRPRCVSDSSSGGDHLVF